MESMLGTALITAIAIENRSLNFYTAVLSRVTDTHTRRVSGKRHGRG
jgi:rubrerythrin